MKRYLIIILITLFFTPFTAAQVVKRTTKTPNFFVPGSVMKSKTDAEKLSSAGNKGVIRGGPASISNIGTVRGEPASVRSTSGIKENISFTNAPVDTILNEQTQFSKDKLKEYKKNIVNSYRLSASDLQKLLQREYDNINGETIRMEAVLEHLKTATPAYRLANFQIEQQISQDMIKNRKRYKKIKEKFTEIIQNTPKGKNIYIIEAKDNLFWIRYELSKYPGSGYVHGYHFKDITYISVFDKDYSYLFSYYRQHLNMLKNQRILAPTATQNFYIDTNIVKKYQQLFDWYLKDLNRISKGLDVNNPLLLKQLDEMQDKTISI